MNKAVKSASVFQTGPGVRLSILYCEIEDGVITKDNIRINRILTEPEDLEKATALLALAQSYLTEG